MIQWAEQVVGGPFAATAEKLRAGALPSGLRCVKNELWVPAFLCAPKFGPWTEGVQALCLFARSTSWLPGGELMWPKNESIWGCNGLQPANTKIALFPQPFYSLHNGISRPLFLSLSHNNDAINTLLGTSLFEGWEL